MISDERRTIAVISISLSLQTRHFPTSSARYARLWLGQQFVDAAPVKADDDFIADDNRRRAAALVGSNELLQRGGILRNVAFDEVDAPLRKILFRRMAGASTVGSEYLNCIFSHFNSLLLKVCGGDSWVGCV
jgi:hypothetical protein